MRRVGDGFLILSLLHFILYFFKHFVYLVIRVIIGFVIEWRLSTFSKLFARHQNGLGSIIPWEFKIYNIILSYMLLSYLGRIHEVVFTILLMILFGRLFLLLILFRFVGCFADTFGVSSEGTLDWRQTRWNTKARTTAAHIDDSVLFVSDLYIIKGLSHSLSWRAVLFSTFYLGGLLSNGAPESVVHFNWLIRYLLWHEFNGSWRQTCKAQYGSYFGKYGLGLGATGLFGCWDKLRSPHPLAYRWRRSMMGFIIDKITAIVEMLIGLQVCCWLRSCQRLLSPFRSFVLNMLFLFRGPQFLGGSHHSGTHFEVLLGKHADVDLTRFTMALGRFERYVRGIILLLWLMWCKHEVEIRGVICLLHQVGQIQKESLSLFATRRNGFLFLLG